MPRTLAFSATCEDYNSDDSKAAPQTGVQANVSNSIEDENANVKHSSRRNITVNDSTGSEHISISDEGDSSGVQVPSHSTGSHDDEYTDSAEEEDEKDELWDYIEPEIEPSDSASRRRVPTKHRSIPPPAPIRRKSTGSHDDEYTDSAEEEEEDEEEEEWDYIEAEIEPSDSASRPRVQTKHRPIPPPVPRPAPIRRKSSHRVPVREAPPRHRSPSSGRHRREREPRQRRRRPESVHSDSLDGHDDYPGYARGPPHPSSQWAHVPHEPPASGYAPSVLSVPPYNPFTSGMPPPPPPPLPPAPPNAKEGEDARAKKLKITPSSIDGGPLSFHVNLQGFKGAPDRQKSKAGRWTWPRSSSRVESLEQGFELMNILAAKRYFNQESEQFIDLVCATDVENYGGQSHQMRWLHMQRQVMDFDEFERAALNTPDLQEDLKLVTLSLLNKIHRDHVRSFLGGYYIEPGTVLRADSRDVQTNAKEDISATFLCLPYLMAGAMEAKTKRDKCERYPLKSLLQWAYQHESTKERDASQAFPKYAKGENTKQTILYVPSLWVLILHNTIVTCAPTSVQDILERSINCLNPNSKDLQGPSLVRVADPHGRLFVFTLQQCQTFFELREVIDQNCLHDISDTMDQCDLLFSDHSALTRETWLPAVKAEVSHFIGVIVQRKKPPIKSIDDGSAALQGPAGQDSHLTLILHPSRTDLLQTAGRDGKNNMRYQATLADPTYQPDPTLPHLLDLDSSSSESGIVQTTDGSSKDGKVNGKASVRNKSQDSLRKAIPTSIPSVEPGNEEAIEGGISREIIYDKARGKVPHNDSEEANWARRAPHNGKPHDKGDKSLALIHGRKCDTLQSKFHDTRVRIIFVGEELPDNDQMLTQRKDTTRIISSSNDIGRQPSPPGWREGACTALAKIQRGNTKLQPFGSSSIVAHQTELQVTRLASQGLLVNDHTAVLPQRAPEVFYLPIEKDPVAEQDTKEEITEDAASGVKTGALPNLELRIPPFLTWATEGPPRSVWEADTPVPSARESRESLDRILTWMDHLMRQRGQGRPGKMYCRALEVTVEELEKTHASLSSQAAPETDAKYQSAQATVITEPLNTAPKNTESFDSIRSYQLSEKDKLLSKIFSLGKELLSFFVPLLHQHCLTGKYWGAIYTIFTVVKKAVDESESSSAQETNVSGKRTSNKDQFWVIRDISDEETLLKNYSIPVPSQRIASCPSCSNGTKYYTFDDGIVHLREAHFRGTEEDAYSMDEPPLNTLTNWLRNNQQLRYDQQFDQVLLQLGILAEHLRALRVNSQQIREGIASNESLVSSRYKLPSSLVKSFEQIIALLLWSARSITLIEKHFRDWNYIAPNSQNYESENVRAASNRLDALGTEAQASMERAEEDFILMSRTENDVETVSYIAVGPEFILASAISNLCKRPIHQGLDVAELYQTFGRNLQLQATKHPRKRLIREIHHVIEEIELIREITGSQLKVLWNFIQVLDDKSFRITTRTRASRFTLEEQFLKTAHRRLERKIRDLDHLRARMINLSSQVAQSVEILEEDHGKAILVFTMVTIVFLPLSFVTGYLGMNTTDIRNSQQNQWLFWAISLPLTSLIVALALVVALRGDSIREMWIDRHNFKEKKLDTSLRNRRYSTLRDESTFHEKEPKKTSRAIFMRRKQRNADTNTNV